MLTLAALFTIILSSFSMIIIKPLSGYLELTIPMVIILLIQLLSAPAVSLTQCRYRYIYHYKGNIAITIYISLATVVATMLLIFNIEDGAMAKILGFALPVVILAVFFWGHTIFSGNLSINIEYWKYGLMISLPLILHSISLNILSQSDRLMITKFCGTTYTAIYTLSYNFAILINIVLHAVNEAWLPWFHDTYFEGKIAEIRKNVKPLIVLGCFIGIGCIAIAPEAIAILGPEEYREGVWAIAPITLGLVCQFIYQQYVHIELHLKKTSIISLGTVFAALINLILNFILIPRYGFVMAAYTTLASYFVLMVAHYIITMKVFKQHIYDNKFMFLVFIITCCIAILFMQLYSEQLLRYIAIVILGLVYLYLNRKYVGVVMDKIRKR